MMPPIYVAVSVQIRSDQQQHDPQSERGLELSAATYPNNARVRQKQDRRHGYDSIRANGKVIVYFGQNSQ